MQRTQQEFGWRLNVLYPSARHDSSCSRYSSDHVEYIKLEANGGNLLLFVHPEISIQAFKAANQMDRTIRKCTLNRRYRPYLLGERCHTRFRVAREANKKFSISLLKRLKKIEADGKCIDGFTQIRVQPYGKVKLRVTLLSKLDRVLITRHVSKPTMMLLG